MYASVSGVCSGVNNSSYVVNGCLEKRLAALAVAASAVGFLASGLGRGRIRLLRLLDDLAQTITLLVGPAALHFRHRRLHFSEPRIRHFVLTAGNESRLARSWAEVPLAAIRMDIV